MEMGSLSLPIALILMAATAPAGFSQHPDLYSPEPAALRRVASADTAFLRALAQGGPAGMEKLLDAGFTWTGAGGKVQSRAQVLRQIPKPLIPAEAKDAQTNTYAYGSLGDIQVNAGRAHVLRVWVKRPEGWKLIVYQELISRDTPPAFTPGAGKDCENPCRSIPFAPANDTEREVARAYTKLETAAHARNSAAFGPLVADEFVALSSNSDKLQTKLSRIAEFDRAKDAGLAPTPLLAARMFVFGDAVLMLSEHKPDRGDPLHVTRVWVKRSGQWVEALSYQTAVRHREP